MSPPRPTEGAAASRSAASVESFAPKWTSVVTVVTLGSPGPMRRKAWPHASTTVVESLSVDVSGPAFGLFILQVVLGPLEKLVNVTEAKGVRTKRTKLRIFVLVPVPKREYLRA